MPGEWLGIAGTLALACVSAVFFLLLRCEGKGRPFGPSSRWWALATVAVTGAVSTATAFIGVLVLSELPAVFLGVGVAGPSGLWLGQLRKGAEERRSQVREASALWLTRLLARMEECMADDRDAWCEARVDPMWSVHELAMAAREYYEYLRERLPLQERRRVRIHALAGAIETRLDVAQMIENGVAKTKVAAVLKESRVTGDARYARYLDDLGRMADILRHDAERDLRRLISAGYLTGYRKLPVYRPAPPVTRPAAAPAGGG